MYTADKNEISARWLITEALMALLANFSFDKITVRDIVQKAGISRSTFYLHFKDKFDLLDQITKQITTEFIDLYGNECNEENLISISKAFDEQQPLPGTVAILDHIRKFENFYQERYKDPNFIIRLSELLYSSLKRVYLDETHAAFAAYGTVGYIGRWLTEGLEGSSSEVALRLTSVALLSLPQVRIKIQKESNGTC